MKITVLLAGVLDPKWPVAPDGDGLPVRPAAQLALSPFDEAALEIALKIRDKALDTEIRVIVGGGEEAIKIARTVCALNVPDVLTVDHSTLWDQAAVARELAQCSLGSDLVLIGREYGDCDDGLVPSMLARLLGYDYFGRVQVLDAGEPPKLLRENGAFVERLVLDRPVVASVTNDRRSRLRKPLMKNVMMARQAQVGAVDAVAAQGDALKLAGVSQVAGSRSAVECTIIEGTLEQQAELLAALLLDDAA
ncbi:MAG: hypothetical protein V7676_00330 [Parasphingorhabdus sp.]|uniref:hypothetical protein n=1 Tax=Parasphingorhabdus sp. TaxID=2709688 RepID=UPI0030018753